MRKICIFSSGFYLLSDREGIVWSNHSCHMSHIILNLTKDKIFIVYQYYNWYPFILRWVLFEDTLIQAEWVWNWSTCWEKNQKSKKSVEKKLDFSTDFRKSVMISVMTFPWSKFGIIENDLCNSIIWAIYIHVSFAGFKNPEIPGIQPNHRIINQTL